MIKQIIINLRKLSRLLIIALIPVVVTIFSGYNKVYADTVYVWYGNVGDSAIDGHINDTVFVDVYIQASGPVYVGDILLCLGANELYIDSMLSETEGEIYYPFIEWDIAEFYSQEGSPPNPEGWINQSFLGWARIAGYGPWLHNEIPLRMLRMAVRTVDDSNLFNQTVEAFGPGINEFQGPSNAGDTLGQIGYPVAEIFSELYFGGGGTVSGTVVDSDSLPVEGVIVQTVDSSLSDTTDYDGRFSIGNIYPGTYDIFFSHPNYYDTTVTGITVIPDGITDLTVSMILINFGFIYGTVTDTSGNVLTGVLVSVLTTEISDITGNDGHYQLLNIPPGTYDISFYLEGYFDSLVADVVVSPGEADSIDAALIIRLSTVMLLYQNYPNPFRTSTNFKFFLPEPAKVTIEVYDILGRKVETVASFQGNAGYNVVGWNAPELVSGVYFYRVQYLDQAVTKSLIKIEY